MVDQRGVITVPALRAPTIPHTVRQALSHVTPGGGPTDPDIDPDWGEPGLTPAERVMAANALEVLALTSGTPQAPVNAIPATARAHCQLRFVVGTPWQDFHTILRAHLDSHGYPMVDVRVDNTMAATRLSPNDPWALGSGLDRAHHPPATRRATQPRRIPAQRRLRRHRGHAHDLGAPFLPRLRPTWPRRTPPCFGGPGGHPDHVRALLGPRRVTPHPTRPITTTATADTNRRPPGPTASATTPPLSPAVGFRLPDTDAGIPHVCPPQTHDTAAATAPFVSLT